MGGIALRFTGAEDLETLQPLWLTLHHHHIEVTAPAVFQDDVASWAARRAAYERWLAEDGSFIVLAERDGAAVGYAFVEILPGPDDTWVTGSRMADVQTLAVTPAERGQGIGTMLLDAVDTRLAEMGIGDVFIAVLTGNADALRFYQRRGLRPVMTHLARFRVDR